MASLIHYAFKGKKHSLDVGSVATVSQLLSAIAEQNEVPATALKVLFKGKVLRYGEDGDSKSLQEQHPGLGAGAKILVLGTTEQDLAKVHSIDEHIQTRKNYRPPPSAKVTRFSHFDPSVL